VAAEGPLGLKGRLARALVSQTEGNLDPVGYADDHGAETLNRRLTLDLILLRNTPIFRENAELFPNNSTTSHHAFPHEKSPFFLSYSLELSRQTRLTVHMG
jgi:hypothetical protein